jgi:hypothetical protein
MLFAEMRSIWTADQILHVDRKLGKRFDTRSVFAERILHYTKIEAGNDDVIPAIPDSSQCYIQHGDNAIAQRLVAVQRDGAKELLALCVSGVVSSRIRFLCGETDFAADAPGDLIGTLGKEVDQGLFLKPRRQLLPGNVAV